MCFQGIKVKLWGKTSTLLLGNKTRAVQRDHRFFWVNQRKTQTLAAREDRVCIAFMFCGFQIIIEGARFAEFSHWLSFSTSACCRDANISGQNGFTWCSLLLHYYLSFNKKKFQGRTCNKLQKCKGWGGWIRKKVERVRRPCSLFVAPTEPSPITGQRRLIQARSFNTAALHV